MVSFDEISHDWLIAHIPLDKAILRGWLKAGYLHNHVLHSTEAGTPQGGIISPTLMNMTLDGLERMLQEKYHSGRKNSLNVNIVRHADDFVITGVTREALTDVVRPTVEQFLAERGLSLSPEKTRIAHIDDGFEFLGMNVRKYGGKLLIKPARANVQRFLRKLRQTVKVGAPMRQDQLIRKLNPLLRGWANYYRHVVSKHTFQAVGHAVWQCLWNWAKRRHPNKGTGWARRKYFRTVGAQHWVFGTETSATLYSGEPELLKLYDIAGTRIRRHRKLKATANPFDPLWERYFEDRLGLAMLDSLKGRKQLIRLWLDQARSCPVCQQMITKSSGWRLYHVIRKIDGGKDTPGNLVMLHPECRRNVRALGLSVVKPARSDGL